MQEENHDDTESASTRFSMIITLLFVTIVQLFLFIKILFF